VPSPVFARRHYEIVAATVAAQVLSQAAKLALANDFSTLFVNDNPGFNHTRFVAACTAAGKGK